MNAPYQKFIMEVWTRGSTGGADGADNVTLSYSLALFYLPFVEVQVVGFVVLPVLNEHVVAVGPGVTRF